MLLLSVIIPVFNGQETIVKTLSTIIHNFLILGIKNRVEFIIVNDGSEDKTESVVNDFIYENIMWSIKYISQKNQGLSVSRNVGLNQAKGEYIWFFDADDILLNDRLVDIFDLLKYREIEVVSFKNRSIIAGILTDDIGCDFPVVRDKIITGIEAFEQGYTPSSVCCLIIKKSLFYDHSIFFYPGITHEDVELTARLMVIVKRIIFIDAKAYGYIYRTDSTSKSKNKNSYIKYTKDNITIADSLQDFSLGLNKREQKQISNIINNIVWNYIYNLFLSKKHIDEEMLKQFLNTLFISKVYPLKGSMQTRFQRLTKNFFNNKFLLKHTLKIIYRF